MGYKLSLKGLKDVLSHMVRCDKTRKACGMCSDLWDVAVGVHPQTPVKQGASSMKGGMGAAFGKAPKGPTTVSLPTV